jgi:methionyl-tRNA formyltransferase/LmbE family N-acetylglucosaminyl deacetylase
MTRRGKVLLIAGLDDGRLVLEHLLQSADADIVGVYVLDEEAGRNVSGFRTFDDLCAGPLLKKIKRIKDHTEEIAALAPDLVIVVGFSQIIPKALLKIPPLGVVGFHSALLPGRRGCSPIIWAIADGLEETGVTMFYMDDGIDTGDVIAARAFRIEASDTAAEVLHKADQATLALVRENLPGILDGTAPRIKQNSALCTYTRKRSPADGEIDWSKPAAEVVNLIRALAPPYPMAHTFAGDGVPILIERAKIATGVQLPRARHRLHDPFRETVLCVAAHPDDEVLGLGGTLILHARAGADVIVLIMSEGEEEKLDGTPRCQTRRQSAEEAAKIMGTREIVFRDFPDQRLDAIPIIDMIKAVESAIDTYRPATVYCHHGGDANSDHNVVFRAVYAACRPMSRLGSHVKRLLTYETPSSTDQAPQVGNYVFNPTRFVDIEAAWEDKVKALQCYPTELIGGKHPRSLGYIEALARMRGGHSGFALAESFVTIRERISSPAP